MLLAFRLILWTFILAATCGAARASEASLVTFFPSEVGIRTLIAEVLPGSPVDVGIAVGVVDVHDARLFSQGYTDKTKKYLIDGNTQFELGDITKVFTGLLLADMLKRGEVKRDDPVSKHLPDNITLGTGSDRPVLLVDLATSSVGVHWNLPRLSANSRQPVLTGFSLRSMGGGDAPNDTYVGSRQYDFSDLGFGILGHVIAKRQKSSYQQILMDRLLRPLTLENTYAGSSDLAVGRMAHGQDAAMTALSPHLHSSMFVGSDGLSSTANDMMKFLRAIIEQRFTRFAFAFRESISVRRATWSANTLSAMGWAILQRDGKDILWRGSDLDGYSTWIGVDLASKRAAFVLANIGSPVATDIGFRLIHPDFQTDHARTRVATRRERLESCSGRYRLNDGQILTVTREANYLMLGLEGYPLRKFFAASDRRFFSSANTSVTFDFESENQPRAKRVVLYQDDRTEVADRIPDTSPRK